MAFEDFGGGRVHREGARVIKILTTLLGFFVFLDLPAIAVVRVGVGEEVFFVPFLVTLGCLLVWGISGDGECDAAVVAAVFHLLLLPVLACLA